MIGSLLVVLLLSIILLIEWSAAPPSSTQKATSSSGDSLLYKDSQDVTTFTTADGFRSRVFESTDFWLIHLYDMESSHIDSVARVFGMTASILKGMFRLGAVDMKLNLLKVTRQRDKSGNIPTGPILLIFGNDKQHPKTYQGKIGAQELTQALLDEAAETFRLRAHRFGLTTGSTEGREQVVVDLDEVAKVAQARDPNNSKTMRATPSGSILQAMNEYYTGAERQSHVVELTMYNFAKTVLDLPAVDKVVFVAFVAPSHSGGPCQRLLPEWEEAADLLQDEPHVLMGIVDATVEEPLARKYAVEAYPTIKVFTPNRDKAQRRTHDDAQTYEGERTAAAIASAALELVDRPPPILEITNSTIFSDACIGPTKKCVMVALPPIRSNTKMATVKSPSGRLKFIEIIQDAAHLKRDWTFLWFQGATRQLDLEKALKFESTYPSVVAMIGNKRRASLILKKDQKHYGLVALTKWLDALETGNLASVPMEQGLVVSIKRSQPWDAEAAVSATIEETTDAQRKQPQCRAGKDSQTCQAM